MGQLYVLVFWTKYENRTLSFEGFCKRLYIGHFLGHNDACMRAPEKPVESQWRSQWRSLLLHGEVTAGLQLVDGVCRGMQEQHAAAPMTRTIS